MEHYFTIHTQIEREDEPPRLDFPQGPVEEMQTDWFTWQGIKLGQFDAYADVTNIKLGMVLTELVARADMPPHGAGWIRAHRNAARLASKARWS
jgi:hypothetical protein